MSASRQPFERIFEPGEMVPCSGIFAVLHLHTDEPEQKEQTVALLRSDKFPQCDECGADVRFRLLRSAPHIHEDEDFPPLRAGNES